jgi:valyl-tRNA synthetase
MTEQGQDIKFSEERMEMSRNFANKIWNASRYILKLLPKSYSHHKKEDFQFKLWDRWILSKLNSTIRTVTESIENYQFDIAVKSLHSFFWDNFCDWYIEITKPILYGTDENEKERTFWILETVLNRFLRLAHPVIPFITEELWSYLPEIRDEKEKGRGEEVMLITTPWPDFDTSMINSEIENEFAFIMDNVKSLRNMRAEASLTPNQTADFLLETPDETELKILEKGKDVISHLSVAKSLKISAKSGESHKRSLSARSGQTDLYMPLEGLVDIEQEINRLEKEREKVGKLAESIRKKLDNPNFVEKAKAEVVEKERNRLAEIDEQLARVDERIRLFME